MKRPLNRLTALGLSLLLTLALALPALPVRADEPQATFTLTPPTWAAMAGSIPP